MVGRDSEPELQPYDTVGVPPEMPTGWTTAEAIAEQVAAAEILEYEVFLSAGFCEFSEHRRVEEFDPWRADSHFMVVSSPEGTVRGAVRVMMGRYDDLPINTFERDGDFPPDPILEYASLAVPADSRRTGVSEWLYREVWRYALRHDVGGVVGIAESWLLELLNSNYPFGFTQLGPSRWYMGGECFPIGTTIVDLIERAKQQPSFFSWATSEIDLRDVPVPSIRDAVVDLRSGRRA